MEEPVPSRQGAGNRPESSPLSAASASVWPGLPPPVPALTVPLHSPSGRAPPAPVQLHPSLRIHLSLCDFFISSFPKVLVIFLRLLYSPGPA